MISCGWIISHRCSWITVYVLCCNAQVNLIVILMTCTCIVIHSLFCQLPNYNLFTQHVIYLYGETPLVNCGSSPLFYICITIYRKHYLLSASIIYFIGNKRLFPHHTFNPLFSINRWDWQPHCKLGQGILVVLCAGSTLPLTLTPRHQRLLLASLPKLASNNLREWFLSPTGRLNLGFILRENLLLCSSYLPLGVSQLVLWDIKTFSGAIAGEKEDFCKESLSLSIFLLCYCFA
jgi:hypothetical protein